MKPFSRFRFFMLVIFVFSSQNLAAQGSVVEIMPDKTLRTPNEYVTIELDERDNNHFFKINNELVTFFIVNGNFQEEVAGSVITNGSIVLDKCTQAKAGRIVEIFTKEEGHIVVTPTDEHPVSDFDEMLHGAASSKNYTLYKNEHVTCICTHTTIPGYNPETPSITGYFWYFMED